MNGPDASYPTLGGMIQTLAGLYALGALAALAFWTAAFLRDPEARRRPASSWRTLVAAAVLWPLALPLAWLERSAAPRGDDAPEPRPERPSPAVAREPAPAGAMTEAEPAPALPARSRTAPREGTPTSPGASGRRTP